MVRRHEAGDHAVVLGASMAGLLTARVLADTYRRVTLVDRDVMPGIGEHRRGVPQGRHLHALQARGREILDELFPGFSDQLIAEGAETGDELGNIRWQLSGHRWLQADVGRPGLFASRPFLEGHVRARVLARPEVALLEGCDVIGPVSSPDRGRVTGVRVQPHGEQENTLDAELVVDATGRGSRMPTWLAGMGCPCPEVDRFEIRLAYTSRTYRLCDGAAGTDRMIVTGGIPRVPRGAILTAIEGGRHLVTATGMLGNRAPTDPAGFEAYVAGVLFPDIAEAIQGAEPLDDPVAFTFPASVRHRYERLRRFPVGLLVIGDAVCSFNPVYGQGMTVAGMQAMALRELLAENPVPDPRRYFRRIARTVDPPWEVTVGGDLAYPDVPGRRTPRVRLINAYVRRLHVAASRDASLGEAFLRVAGLLDRPEGLMRPDRAFKVLRPARRRPGRPREGVAP